MEIYLDDRPYSPQSEGMSLGTLLDDVKEALTADGRIVVGIHCDGIDVTTEEFDAQLEQPINLFDRIELKSADPQTLMADALDHAFELLAESEQTSLEVVDLLGAGQSEAALNRLGTCCTAWIQIHQGICQVIAMLNLDVEQFKAGGKTLDELLGQPIQQLGEIKNAVESQDLVTLADMISYEFPESIACWRTIIAKLQASVAGSQATTIQ